LPFVVGATGCTRQQAAADQVCQPCPDGVETEIQLDLRADEHAASETTAMTTKQGTEVPAIAL
jgi:hypothetical protein